MYVFLQDTLSYRPVSINALHHAKVNMETCKSTEHGKKDGPWVIHRNIGYSSLISDPDVTHRRRKVYDIGGGGGQGLKYWGASGAKFPAVT